MAIDANALGIHRMSVEERLELLDALLASLEAEGAAPGLSDEQVAELERRLADAETHPGDVVDWEVVKAEALSRLRK